MIESTIPIVGELAIPIAELEFATARSGGPGGQNVNKVESKVTLRFDVAGSPQLNPSQRQRIAERLATRIGKDGWLRVTSQRHRTQAANRAAAVERFADLLRAALKTTPRRRATKPSAAAKARRLEDKRQRARRKGQRSKVGLRFTDSAGSGD